MIENRFRCTQYNCFGYNMGVCEALKEPCKYKSGHCKFFKPKQTYIQELKQCALKLNCIKK